MATKQTSSRRSGGGKSKSTTTIKAHVDSNSSVGVRQIKNGFIVSESGYTGKGKNQTYYNNEWFSKTNPIKLGGTGSSNGGGSADFLGEKSKWLI